MILEAKHALYFYQHPLLLNQVNDKMCSLPSMLLSFIPGLPNRWHLFSLLATRSCDPVLQKSSDRKYLLECRDLWKFSERRI